VRSIVFLFAAILFAPIILAAPSGTFIEMHSCEVYTGGCTASAQATGDGRYMLQMWKIASGDFNGVDLKGESIALLQVAKENLAWTESAAESGIVYLPASSNPQKRAALLKWLISHTQLNPSVPHKVVPIKIENSAIGWDVSIGSNINFTARAIHECDAGSCGEALWYWPKSSALSFTVAMAEQCQVLESDLRLHWTDHAARSLFLGQFGDTPKLAQSRSAADSFPVFLSPDKASALF
jgi:hypothetical protein